jgi:transcriptional regulator with XRE-family HTH domain
MNKIFIKLNNICENKNISITTLAEKLGLSVASVSNYFGGEQQMKFIKFVQLLDILIEDYKNKIDLIFRFCKDTPTLENDRVAIEWASNYSEFELQEYLITKMAANATNKTHAEPHKHLLKRNKKQISKQDFFDVVSNINKKSNKRPETEVLREISYIYSLWDLGVYNINLMIALAEKAKGKIIEINSEDSQYIRDSYLIKINEMLANIHLKNNDVEKAREFAHGILSMDNREMFPSPLISTYRILAESYLLENPKTAIEYIDKSVDLLSKGSVELNNLKKEGIRSTSDFIRIYNRVYTNLYLDDKSERAHYHASKGEGSKAVGLLNEIEKEQGCLTPHQLYYKALALNSKTILKQSEKEFYGKNDFYYAQIPEICLEE